MGTGVEWLIASTLFKTYSTIASARAQAAGLSAQAQQAEYEAANQRMQANQIDVQRQEEAKASSFRQEDLADKARLVAGQNAAALGGAGLDTSSGLGYDTAFANWNQGLGDNNKELMNLYGTDRNLRQTQNNMITQALGLEQAAVSYRSQAKSAKRAGIISALGGLALDIGTMSANGMFKGAGGKTPAAAPVAPGG
jgi:hypothetical protein